MGSKIYRLMCELYYYSYWKWETGSDYRLTWITMSRRWCSRGLIQSMLIDGRWYFRRKFLVQTFFQLNFLKKWSPSLKDIAIDRLELCSIFHDAISRGINQFSFKVARTFFEHCDETVLPAKVQTKNAHWFVIPKWWRLGMTTTQRLTESSIFPCFR